jgi:hypothetical protein
MSLCSLNRPQKWFCQTKLDISSATKCDLTVMNLVTPKDGAKHVLLFNKKSLRLLTSGNSNLRAQNS